MTSTVRPPKSDNVKREPSRTFVNAVERNAGRAAALADAALVAAAETDAVAAADAVRAGVADAAIGDGAEHDTSVTRASSAARHLIAIGIRPDRVG